MTVLIVIPSRDFDPSEVAISWKVLCDAGLRVRFATPDGRPGQGDPLMLSGEGLDPWGFIPLLKRMKLLGLGLRADARARRAYAQMVGSEEFQHPLKYVDVDMHDFDGLVLPGGHRAAGMRPYLESPVLQRLVASFFETDGFGGLLPTFTLANYVDVLTSAQTFHLYVATLKFALLTWLFTLIIGFLVAYFLVFHVKNQLLAIGLFLICTIPFWTSNIIRMISWIPLLGKEGLVNSALLDVHLIKEPLEVLLYSGFSVVVAYVHQLTIFMVVPIFNSLARIDKRVVEAALDAGASRLDVMRFIVIPMSKSGIALGSTFVISIVMGDFFVVKVMSGGSSASVVSAFYENVGVLQYPIAAASAVLLTVILVAVISLILRVVDIRREITQ